MLKLITEVIDKKEIKTNTFFFNSGKRNNVDPTISPHAWLLLTFFICLHN